MLGFLRHPSDGLPIRQLFRPLPHTFFRLNPRQVAIDEAPALPAIFPALQVAIDDQRLGLQFTPL